MSNFYLHTIMVKKLPKKCMIYTVVCYDISRIILQYIWRSLSLYASCIQDFIGKHSYYTTNLILEKENNFPLKINVFLYIKHKNTHAETAVRIYPKTKSYIWMKYVESLWFLVYRDIFIIFLSHILRKLQHF